MRPRASSLTSAPSCFTLAPRLPQPERHKAVSRHRHQHHLTASPATSACAMTCPTSPCHHLEAFLLRTPYRSSLQHNVAPHRPRLPALPAPRFPRSPRTCPTLPHPAPAPAPCSRRQEALFRQRLHLLARGVARHQLPAHRRRRLPAHAGLRAGRALCVPHLGHIQPRAHLLHHLIPATASSLALTTEALAARYLVPREACLDEHSFCARHPVGMTHGSAAVIDTCKPCAP